MLQNFSLIIFINDSRVMPSKELEFMKKIKKYLKILGFVLLIILSSTGIGIPISMFLASRFFVKENHQEQVDEKENEEKDYEIE